MKFLSTWLRNTVDVPGDGQHGLAILNEVPEHMAQEFQKFASGGLFAGYSSMKFLSTWLRNIMPTRCTKKPFAFPQ